MQVDDRLRILSILDPSVNTFWKMIYITDPPAYKLHCTRDIPDIIESTYLIS